MAASPQLETITTNQNWSIIGFNLDVDVKLEGRFYGNNPPQPMFPQFFVPSYEQSKDSVKIEWESMQCPDWKAKLSFNLADPKSAVFEGKNIPSDVTLTRFDQEENMKFFRFDSKTNLEFWAGITIIKV
jgi:hypothetical protein